jgi:hypothetical protein
VAGLLGDQLEDHEAQVAVIEEPAHATAATAMGAAVVMAAMEPEGVTAVMLVTLPRQ